MAPTVRSPSVRARAFHSSAILLYAADISRNTPSPSAFFSNTSRLFFSRFFASSYVLSVVSTVLATSASINSFVFALKSILTSFHSFQVRIASGKEVIAASKYPTGPITENPNPSTKPPRRASTAISELNHIPTIATNATRTSFVTGFTNDMNFIPKFLIRSLIGSLPLSSVLLASLFGFLLVITAKTVGIMTPVTIKKKPAPITSPGAAVNTPAEDMPTTKTVFTSGNTRAIFSFILYFFST